ncbi:MAG TPA: GMC family oxidoreductase N-terminal domain-containing protein [Acidimicrobiia bacterium]|nr:GMC family oxidoreductase N-terminal domain-containing protein [Acidimicrobiia bacterium]
MPDFVIVGAGSAGCVLAEALSARHSVVVLEAGGADRGMEVAIPAAFSKLFKTAVDWNFSSEPEPGALGRTLYLPRGKMVGGSSSMNAMIYMRGRPSNYDGWEKGGANGWGWDSVLPVFKAQERNSRGADEFHGDRGALRVEDIRDLNPLSRCFVEAALATGIPANADFNGPSQVGAGFFQVTQKRGRRWSAADAFLRPALSRPTLELRMGVLVIRIAVEAGRAVGVEYVREGRSEMVGADLGVIVAAGAYGSPHLLQLSGIGDPDHLHDIGVEPVAEVPGVGRNLQDHPASGVIYESTRPGTLDDAETPGELARWLLLRRGRLTSNVAEAGAFVSSTGGSEPDLQFHFGPVHFQNHGLERYDGHAFTFGPVLVNPKSRGSVMARDSDPMTPPAIAVNCLADRADLDALIQGVEMARDIGAQGPFDGWRGAELTPGEVIHSRDALESFVRENVELLYHPVGTCRMGSDEDAVVDPELRVRGVEGLRVADASVMPTVVSGNTNAPTMMIAARAAEMILASVQPSNGSSSWGSGR